VVVNRPLQGPVVALRGAGLVMLGFALAQAMRLLAGFDRVDEMAITAHRGSSRESPENKLAALRQAASDGAYHVEAVLRETADGVPALLHDRDPRRVAGLDRRVWEARTEGLAAIAVGSWQDPVFAGERVPRLEQAIAAAGRGGGSI